MLAPRDGLLAVVELDALDARDLASLAHVGHGLGLPRRAGAVHLGRLPLVGVAAHLRLGAAVDHGHRRLGQAQGLAHHVQGGVAATGDDHVLDAVEAHGGQLEPLDPVHGPDDPVQLLAGQPQVLVRPEPGPHEHRVVVALDVREGDVLSDLDAGLDLDPADGHDPLDLFGRPIRLHLVGRDAVDVQAAQEVALLEDRAGVAKAPQPMRRRQARGPAADEGDALARVGASLEEPPAGVEGHVRAVPLELADLDRRDVHLVVDAVADAEHLDRADPGAAHAEHVAVEDGPSGAAHVASGDLPDELGDVDAGGTRLDTGRIFAIQAAVRFDFRLSLVIGRLVVLKHVLRALLRQRTGHRASVRGRFFGQSGKRGGSPVPWDTRI